ncbi:hypothetical protein HanRHA438_Chr15g0706831 [Helianthus annuus]|nr:hypothetical protein HanRHA438_Chr15g0706831 [Helianthus annuus]
MKIIRHTIFQVEVYRRMRLRVHLSMIMIRIKNVDSFHPEDHAYEQKEVEQGDMLASEVSANMQQLNIQEERHLDEPEDDVPSVVIPNHLQVQTANCSHLSFGSFGSTMNPRVSEPFASRQLRNKLEDTPAEVDSSSVGAL